MCLIFHLHTGMSNTGGCFRVGLCCSGFRVELLIVCGGPVMATWVGSEKDSGSRPNWLAKGLGISFCNRHSLSSILHLPSLIRDLERKKTRLLHTHSFVLGCACIPAATVQPFRRAWHQPALACRSCHSSPSPCQW